MSSWNKGFTKTSHPGVAKISMTMKRRRVDNFREWRDFHRTHYTKLIKSGQLAEYLGVVLGDGNIEKYPRTERLTIIGDANKPEFVIRYAKLAEELFGKSPSVKKAQKSNAVRISLYQKFISKRLGIPTGNKKFLAYELPSWIKNRRSYLLRFLRGLFEADGYLCIHFPTCTYNFGFSNYNPYLLKIVENALRKLEFHPEVRHNAIRIRRKAEVAHLKELLHFREY